MARLKTGKRGTTNAHILAEESISWNQPCKNHNACGTNTTGLRAVRLGDSNNTVVFCRNDEEEQQARAKMGEYFDNRVNNLLRGTATMY